MTKTDLLDALAASKTLTYTKIQLAKDPAYVARITNEFYGAARFCARLCTSPRHLEAIQGLVNTIQNVCDFRISELVINLEVN